MELSLLEGTIYGGWGVVIRKHEGQVVAASAWATRDSESIRFRDAFMAELKALEQTNNLASEMGVIRPLPDFSPAASIIQGLNIQRRMWFSSCSVTTCRREANPVAHEFSKIRFFFELIQDKN